MAGKSSDGRIAELGSFIGKTPLVDKDINFAFFQNLVQLLNVFGAKNGVAQL